MGHHRDGRPGTRYESWNVDDPAALDLVDVRPIRDEIERRVRRLLDQLNVPATRQPTTARRSGTATSQGRTD
ncbi:hypothetical protein G3554_19560 [Micromonospora sp. PPF5-17]|uniref:Phosphotyrosine protein phosphatase I domain-containing protein n=1 Tax=Micromonospora solifontis TaxID=2487138 RepID=A0ABX9WC85_9ACTN|nr:hypothetical protein [Micromonospora sp. PPF5-17B]NES38343.1 hypothetical protein [Micromonospora solifontis]NES58095.1 hypothetical protein [Micromonospora sp. PPF5-6]RNL95898.1 hypothetical protein EFE23_19640 [Micromonospora solifontis]